MKDSTALASEVLEKIPNKYMAVIVAAKRAKAINDGSRPQIKSGATKPTTLALEEIAADIVVPATKKPEIEEVKEEESELLPPPEAQTEAETETETDTETESESEEE